MIAFNVFLIFLFSTSFVQLKKANERQRLFVDHHREHMSDDEESPVELSANRRPQIVPHFYCPTKCECEMSTSSGAKTDHSSSSQLSLEPRKRYQDSYYNTYFSKSENNEEKDHSSANRRKKMTRRSTVVAVYCRRGNLTDTDFSEILQQITVSADSEMEVATLEIIAPMQRSNFFRWNDNLNRLTRLRKLALVNCGIPALSQGVRMSSLKYLDLSWNNIDAIQLGSFIGLPSLETLDLSHNQIQALPTGAFMYSKRLTRLALSHNKITELASSMLRGPDQLIELELDGNGRLYAQQLNDLFIDVPSLKRLELNNCGLNDAEINSLMLSRLPSLLRLGLGKNNLTKVPTVQRALEHLQVIDLSHNTIRELGPCAFCASNISRVLLAHNLLGLGGVATTSSPHQTFKAARSSNNPWRRAAIHREAFADTQIVELDLSHNFYDDFDSEMLEGVQSSLQILHLSGNSISTLHDRLIRSLPRVIHLHMAENRIRSVPYSLPKEYSYLKLLNLSGNGLEELPSNLAGLLPSLEVLDISQNRFSSLSPTLMSTFIEILDRVYFHHNPWDCECAVHNIQQYMLQRLSYKTELRYDETLCENPPLLRNQSLYRVEKLNDCAILFGATHGLTQASELLLLLGALLVAAFLVSVLVIILLYCGREHKQKAVYLTHEQSRMHLTHPLDVSTETNSGASTTGSTLSEPMNNASTLLLEKKIINNNDSNAKNYMNGTLLKGGNGTMKNGALPKDTPTSTLIRQPLTKAAAAQNQRIQQQQQYRRQQHQQQQQRSPPPPGTMFVTF